MSKKILHFLIIIVLLFAENTPPIIFVGANDSEVEFFVEGITDDKTSYEQISESEKEIETPVEETDTLEDKSEILPDSSEDITNENNDEKSTIDEEKDCTEKTNNDNNIIENIEDTDDEKENRDKDTEDVSNNNVSEEWTNIKDWRNDTVQENTPEINTPSEIETNKDHDTDTPQEDIIPQDPTEIPSENNEQQNSEFQTNTSWIYQNIWWWSSRSIFISQKYLITFNDENWEPIESIKYEKWEDIIPLAYLEKEWYTLDWRYNEDYSIKYDFPILAESDLTLYAKWEERSLSINPVIINDITVFVEWPVLAFSEDVILSVEEILEAEAEWISGIDHNIENFLALDIKFLNNNGIEIEPLQPIQISFSFSNNSEIFESIKNQESEVSIYHADDINSEAELIANVYTDETQIINTNSNVQSVVLENDSVTIKANHFSPYYFVIKGIDSNTSELDNLEEPTEDSFEMTTDQLNEWSWWIISIENPNYGNDSEIIPWFTIMDRNLWASTTGFWSSASKDSYWFYYQWGNNYWFSLKWNNIPSKTTTKAKWDDSYIHKWYIGTSFITNWNDYWDDGYHDNLRWWENDKNDVLRWLYADNFTERQWPCPNGYHIPSAGERNEVFKYWCITNPDCISIFNSISSWIGEYQSNISIVNDFSMYFSIPYSNYIETKGSANSKNNTFLWTSSAYNDDKSRDFLLSSKSSIWLYSKNSNNRTLWFPIRCFKNDYQPLPLNHTISFVTNTSNSIEWQYVAKWWHIKTPTENLIKDWYIFDGWYTESEWWRKWNFNEDIVTEDITLYAHWNINIQNIEITVPNKFSFTYDNNREILTSKDCFQTTETKTWQVSITDNTNKNWHTTISLNMDINYSNFKENISSNLKPDTHKNNNWVYEYLAKDINNQETMYSDIISLRFDIPPFTNADTYYGIMTFTLYEEDNNL